MGKENKTQPTAISVNEYISEIKDIVKKNDCIELDKIISKLTGKKAVMWGKSIAGYGTLKYKLASGEENKTMITGFSARKANISIYLMSGFDDMGDLLEKLGPHKLGKACLYIKRLSDIDMEVLEKIIQKSIIDSDKNGFLSSSTC